MSADLVAKHLDAIEAQIDLLKVQVQGLRHAVTLSDAPLSARPSTDRPARCADVPDQWCGLIEDDARMNAATLTAPQRWECRGCRERLGDVTMSP